jgi:hypothetical protein
MKSLPTSLLLVLPLLLSYVPFTASQMSFGPNEGFNVQFTDIPCIPPEILIGYGKVITGPGNCVDSAVSGKNPLWKTCVDGKFWVGFLLG